MSSYGYVERISMETNYNFADFAKGYWSDIIYFLYDKIFESETDIHTTQLVDFYIQKKKKNEFV